MRRAMFAIVLAAACGGGSSKSSTMSKADGPTCAAVADSMVAMMSEGKEATKAMVDTKEDFAAIIRTRCDEDRWTAEARQCLSTMKSRADAERCSTLLTDEQQANLVRDQQAKFGAEPPAEPPTPEPAAEPAPTGAAPPPPAAPMKAEEGKMGTKDKDAPNKKAPAKGTKTRRAGDPCDGGE